MTQALIIGVLLISVIGLLWVIALSIWAEAQPVDASIEQREAAQPIESSLKRHTIAA